MSKILFFLLIISSSYIQAQSAMISGKIIVDDTKEIIDLEGISIENLNTKAKTKTNNEGLFSINVNLNDELLIKQVGLSERKLKVSETMITKGFVTIHVNVEIIDLAETNIQKLNKDAYKNIGKEKSFQEKFNDENGITSLEFKAELNLKHEEEIVNRTIKQVGGVNLLGLFNLFKSPKKRLKKPVQLEVKKEDQLSTLHKFFTTYYFVNDLKIPEGKINEFLDYCYSNFDFPKLLKENNFDEILFIIEEQAPIYLSKMKKNE
ncbi:hypothetical protein [Empedobacter brevis]|uniref:hypothetical protein n=1 Tax=Empedobacter brevis TaxID=247 RepID=UPI0039B09EA1